MIYENEIYYIDTGESTDPETAGQTTYICVNKETKMVEIEARILPQIIDIANQMASHLVALRNQDAEALEAAEAAAKRIPFNH